MRAIKRKSPLLVLAALIAAISAASVLFSADNTTVSYKTQPLERGAISIVISTSGTLHPKQLVTVGAQISGQISKMHVKVNDRVKKGQLLAEIDPSLLFAELKRSRSSMESARITYEQADRDLQRTRMLLEKEYVAKIDLEHAQAAFVTAKNNYEAAKSQVERDEVNLNYAKIYSPIDGIVASQDTELGQTLASNFQSPKLFTISSELSSMKIDISLSDSEISKVKVGMPVNFTVDAFPDKQFFGAIRSVSLYPVIQQLITYTAVVEVDNSDLLLFPGMTAFVTIQLDEKKDILRVPAAALRFKPLQGKESQKAQNPGVPQIHVLRNNLPVAIPVTTGITDGVFVEISGDALVEGELVITGLQRLGK